MRGPLPAERSVAGAGCWKQPTYEAVLDELCCLIRWDTARTFCFYCWRKKIVLILISNGSAGSYFSQRKMLEEMFKLHMTLFLQHNSSPFSSGCAKQLVVAAGAWVGVCPSRSSPFTSSRQLSAAVRKMVPIPKLCRESPAHTFSNEMLAAESGERDPCAHSCSAGC